MARLTDNNFTKKDTLDENNDYLLVDNATQGSAAVTVKTLMDKHKGEPHLTISTTATSGVDKDLRDALAEKGWSDQIVNGEINIKAMFAEIAASSAEAEAIRGEIISNSGSDISIESGGSLKNTDISISVPSGAWVICIYADFGGTDSGTYRGVSYRYRDDGGAWKAPGFQYNTVPITGSTAVHTTTVLTNFDKHTTTREYEITVRSNPAITFSGTIKAIRIA